MKGFEDNQFDLAIVDPPYGIARFGNRVELSNRLCDSAKLNTWDIKPTQQYFDELFRVSKFQIIWGANNFTLPNTEYFIVWDKDNSGDFADCELAWTSLNTAVRKFKWRWNGMLQQNMKDKEVRIHPTQKPIALYEWIFQNYTSEGNLILDTHLGSGSSRIAAEKNKLNFVGCEIDKEYFDAQEARFKEFKSQLRLW